MNSNKFPSRGIQNNSQPHQVITDDDLLTEILIRLPILCIHLFTTVSKQWLRILTSNQFTDRRRRIPNLDTPCGIFVNRLRSLFECDFVSLDPRLNSKNTTMYFGSAGEGDQVRILQSCNGLLLCCGSAWPISFYVYNPSTGMSKKLPQPETFLTDPARMFNSCVYRLGFDPLKSSYYNVVQIGGSTDDIWVEIYSSETGNWRLYKDRFSYIKSTHFESATYWNDAFHWLEGSERELKHCELSIKDNQHPTMTSCLIRHGVHMGKKFLESFFGPINDQVCLLDINIPSMLHLESKFFVSCGFLYLVCREDIGSTKFNIYEMMNGAFVWSVKYSVNIGLLMDQIPEEWSIRTCVWGIYLGKGEEDAFVVMNLSGKVVKYNLITKAYIEIFLIESKQNVFDQAVADDDDNDDDYDDEDNPEEFLVPPFLADPNMHEFIPCLANV